MVDGRINISFPKAFRQLGLAARRIWREHVPSRVLRAIAYTITDTGEFPVCLHHHFAIALKHYGTRDFGSDSCPRCKPDLVKIARNRNAEHETGLKPQISHKIQANYH